MSSFLVSHKRNESNWLYKGQFRFCMGRNESSGWPELKSLKFVDAAFKT